MSIIAKEAVISHLESTEEFPIALSEVWEWLGFSTKGNAQKAFERLELNEGEDFEVVILKDKNLSGGRPLTETKLTIDCFKIWAMSAQTSKGKEVRRYYLQIEREWKSQKSAIPPVSLEQVEAFQFQKGIFDPWVQDHPIAATVFLGWQGINSVLPTPSTVPTLTPSLEAQSALNGAFLNLNRSGLMMNKLFKFLDRIPTMKALDEDFVNDLVQSLSESERLRERVESELEGTLSRMRKMKTEQDKASRQAKATEAELEKMRQRCDGCNMAIPVESIVCNGSSPKRLKPAI